MLHELCKDVSALVHGGVLSSTSPRFAQLRLKSVTARQRQLSQSAQELACVAKNFPRTVLARAKRSDSPQGETQNTSEHNRPRPKQILKTRL
jgi:hypothetical protein